MLTAKFALLENTTHYQTQQIKHLKKAIEAMQEREQDFHLLSIGNMVTELFKRNGLVDAYRATFNIQNSKPVYVNLLSFTSHNCYTWLHFVPT